MSRHMYFDNYSPVGDLIVISICLVIGVLLFFSYVRRTRSFRIFLSILVLLAASAYADLGFYVLAARLGSHTATYALRCTYHGLLFLIFVCFVDYIIEVTRLNGPPKRRFLLAAWGIFFAVVGLDVGFTLAGNNFVIEDTRIVFRGMDFFMYGYLAFVALIAVLFTQVHKRLYRRVMLGFYSTIAVSFVILLLQGTHGQSSFTVVTFLYPVIAMFYILHSNPYDVQLGAIDSRSMEEIVSYNYRHKIAFVFMSLYLPDYDEEGKNLPEELQATIRRFAADYFKGATLFQVGRGHMMLMFREKHNPDYRKQIDRMLDNFYVEYERFKLDYKIVIGRSVGEVSRKNEYVSFIQDIHCDMEDNTVHWVGPEDEKRFNQRDYILKQLEDIYHRHDLNDPRVQVFCQPVFNIRSQRYDTAEALMRLELENVGLVSPLRFISLAEENGYIHVLTEIILNKTCAALKKLTQAGYEINRVSINVSALELKDEGFCDDIRQIIRKNGVSGEKIAIELTESQTDSDFRLMKHKIDELREQGIKFYLDDFGTGYSNMERIMELPFDIIKFDRSLVIASGASERSRMLVDDLANLFAEMNFSVLYEGVETDSDEARCVSMAATYLQGFKYSRPVPIDNLAEFLERGKCA